MPSPKLQHVVRQFHCSLKIIHNSHAMVFVGIVLLATEIIETFILHDQRVQEHCCSGAYVLNHFIAPILVLQVLLIAGVFFIITMVLNYSIETNTFIDALFCI